MLEYLTEFLPIGTDEEMTKALNVRAVEGWGISRFEPEHGHTKVAAHGSDNHHVSKKEHGYRVVWCRNMAEAEGLGPAHAHVQLQPVRFQDLPPALQQIVAGLGGPQPPGYQPSAHKPPKKD